MAGIGRTVLVAGLAAVVAIGPAGAAEWRLPPINAKADYQLGGDYPPPVGVTVVARDWFAGTPLKSGYSICYINAFQTQPDDDGVDRPDKTGNWPAALVLRTLEDPNWPGEYLIDISTSAKRAAAARHVAIMIESCRAKGFHGVEFDNLDSWSRYRGTDLEDAVPFGRKAAVAYAKRLTKIAHDKGLAVGQKNTVELGRHTARKVIGFDFAVVEECGTFNECDDFFAIYGSRIIAIEYTARSFAKACKVIGAGSSVMLRDRNLVTPDNDAYRYKAC